MSCGIPVRLFLVMTLTALLSSSCRAVTTKEEPKAYFQIGSPAATTQQKITAQLSVDPVSASVTLIGSIAAIIGTAQNWPKPSPGDNSIEYIFYGSSSTHQFQCPLVIQTVHENDQSSQHLISEGSINKNCSLDKNAHLKAGNTVRGWADHQPSKLVRLKITSTGPQLASFSRIILRLGGNLQQTGLGDRAMIMLDAGLVDYCYKRGSWKFGGNPIPTWSTEFKTDRSWIMQMGTSNQWEEFEFFSIEEMIQDLSRLGEEKARWNNSEMFHAEEAVEALDRLCHHFQPTKWNEGKTCARCCSFTQTKRIRNRTIVGAGKEADVVETETCEGPLLPEQGWAPNN
jgi:hypothetical protein